MLWCVGEWVGLIGQGRVGVENLLTEVLTQKNTTSTTTAEKQKNHNTSSDELNDSTFYHVLVLRLSVLE